MKKIKFLMIAMMAFTVCTMFTACGDDDNNNNNTVVPPDPDPVVTPPSNYDRYQQDVNNIVNAQKKNNKVILVVAFGSTWEQAYDTFEKVVEDYKASFPDWDVFLSFSSAICINQARAGENVEPRDFYDPEHFLTAIGLAGYEKIIVQSLQVIPGEEYRRVRDSYVKDFMNNRNGDFPDAYMKSIDRQVVVGTPLMAEEGIVAFMGHGNPEGYDYYGGNIRYLQLEDALRAINKNYYVGTVDMAETYAEDVLDHIGGGKFDYHVGAMGYTANYEKNNAKKAQLFVLMSIAGDHAHNDMADEKDPESWVSLFKKADIETAAYETNFTEACWKNTAEIKANGYIPGLAERSAVRALWKKHTSDAIKKLGTDAAMSTPTTASE